MSKLYSAPSLLPTDTKFMRHSALADAVLSIWLLTECTRKHVQLVTEFKLGRLSPYSSLAACSPVIYRTKHISLDTNMLSFTI